MSEGWIKLYRKFDEWEWFNISEMVHLFIYLLLNANHEDGEWRGVNIKRGQIITGLHKLNERTKISLQTIRTCLERLKKTGEINIQTTNQYSIITILNYESYQGSQQTPNKPPNKRVTNDQQTGNNKQEGLRRNKEFYDAEKLKTDDKRYHLFVEYLFGKNDVQRPLSKILNMKDPIGYPRFLELFRIAAENGTVMLDKINDIENSEKKYESFNLTLTNWLKNRFRK